MFDYVYTDHAQYTIKTYAKMALFPLLLTGPLSLSLCRSLVLMRETAYTLYRQACRRARLREPAAATE